MRAITAARAVVLAAAASLGLSSAEDVSVDLTPCIFSNGTVVSASPDHTTTQKSRCMAALFVPRFHTPHISVFFRASKQTRLTYTMPRSQLPRIVEKMRTLVYPL